MCPQRKEAYCLVSLDVKGQAEPAGKAFNSFMWIDPCAHSIIEKYQADGVRTGFLPLLMAVSSFSVSV
ncbi:hypothetical protein FGO68_gene12050 [Halteria grandinella]|uniref:Uncharacterized protein n=1 Tax=Halteria grandinella TaxID=5974 RepID=A0A8J8T9C0_HALGN|nr:hypothetical protein FGO68_gene12050 [Halteria grandinella]